MKMSPLGAITTLVGWVRASGGFPATPGFPSVNRTLSSGLNFTTMWPLSFSPENFASSRSFADLWSATHTLPSRSTYILCGKINIPVPKLFTRLPDESNFRTGGRVEPAQLSYWNADAPGGVSGFAPHRSATQMDSPSRSMSTALRAPQVLPSGSFAHGAMDWYGLGRSLVG